MKGIDLRYMPQIAIDREIEDFRPLVLQGDVLRQVFDFCECLGYQLIRDTFMKHKRCISMDVLFLPYIEIQVFLIHIQYRITRVASLIVLIYVFPFFFFLVVADLLNAFV